jgi:hypothetical protein
MTKPADEERRLSQAIVLNRNSNQALLVYHKSGRWAGFYTGLLDEATPGEEPAAAAARIAAAQVGITTGPASHRATFLFSSEAWGRAREFEFLIEAHTGDPVESDTLRPEWFDFEAIPYDRMPADDAIWYPPFLDGKRMRGHFDFAPDGQTLIAHEVKQVEPGEVL